MDRDEAAEPQWHPVARTPSTESHCMNNSLYDYILPKIHTNIIGRDWAQIRVIGLYSRSPPTRITATEKRRKPFNWQTYGDRDSIGCCAIELFSWRRLCSTLRLPCSHLSRYDKERSYNRSLPDTHRILPHALVCTVQSQRNGQGGHRGDWQRTSIATLSKRLLAWTRGRRG